MRQKNTLLWNSPGAGWHKGQGESYSEFMSGGPVSLWCSAELVVAVKNYFSIPPKVQGGYFLRICTSDLRVP